MYAAGQTTYEIAEHFAVSPTPVASALRRQGVELRPSGKKRTHWTGTPEQSAEVAAAYQDGESIRDIAARLKIRAQVIIQCLDDAEVPRRGGGGRPMFTDDEAAEMEAAYLEGATLTQIAEQFDTSHITIRNYLVKRGVELRAPGVSLFWTDERRAEAARRYKAGQSQQQIADALGCDQTTVSNALYRLDIRPRADMPRMERHGSWKGGRFIDGDGYVRVKLPDADRHLITPLSNGYVMEHRLVMARHLGRPLLPDENVHHQRSNSENEIEHLELWTSSQPKGRRAEEIVEWAEAMLRRYAPEKLK